MPVKNPPLALWLLLSLFAGKAVAGATVQVQFSEPKWQFLLNNQPLAQTEAQLAPTERNFARSVQPSLASQDYQAVWQAFADRPLAQDSAALQVLRGQVALTLKHYDQAVSAFRAALSAMPELTLAQQGLSMVYMLKQDYASAQPLLAKSIAAGRADAQTYGQLAYVNLQLKDAGSAIAGYQQALFLEPDNLQWRQGLLYALTQSRAFAQAAGLLEGMLEKNGDDPQLWLTRGQLALQQGQQELALSSLEVALRLGEKSAANLALAAQLHVQQGSMQRAVALLETGLKLADIQPLVTTLEQTTAWLAHQQQWPLLDKLFANLDKHMAALPKVTQARIKVVKASQATQAGRQEQAQRWLNEAIEADPANSEAALNLATLLHEKKQWQRARSFYVRAKALADTSERAILGLAQLEIDQGRYQDALTLLNEILRKQPGRSDIAANIRALETLVRQQGRS
ncbi:tetratricopeptide repeat protein [Bowmanella denitrificans]|uniref:tetratricopeptide repeat protein n=1 Tax=Bowmanella denitrificans TaxID=366582 RepID=UPI000C9B144A|nr:tetratricopeptide repeat protein [Bowmanella denitrificans]